MSASLILELSVDATPCRLALSVTTRPYSAAMASTECGWCGHVAHMNAASALTLAPNGTFESVIQAAYRCPGCHRLNIAQEEVGPGGSFGSFGSISDAQRYEWDAHTEWLPRKDAEQQFPDVPPHIAAAATEATRCQSAKAFRAVGSLARAVIEATAKDKEADGHNLQARIDALAEAGHIREHTTAQAHEVRHFGNSMAHGDFVDPVTEEEAAEVVELMSEVLNEVYQSPAKLARVREAREAKKAERKINTTS